jgi:hypothetical protein
MTPAQPPQARCRPVRRRSAALGIDHGQLKGLGQHRWEQRGAVDLGGQAPPGLQMLTVQMTLHRRHIQLRRLPRRRKAPRTAAPQCLQWNASGGVTLVTSPDGLTARSLRFGSAMRGLLLTCSLHHDVPTPLGDPGEGDPGAHPPADLGLRSAKGCRSHRPSSYSALTTGGSQQGPAWT